MTDHHEAHIPEQVREMERRSIEISSAASPEGTTASPTEPTATATTQAQVNETHAAPSVSQVAGPDANAELAALEQKYRTLQGMHRNYTSQIEQLRAENDSLKAQINSAATVANGHVQTGNLSLESIRDQFGDELVDAVYKIASDIADQRVGAVRQDVERTRAESAYERTVSQVAGLVPDWQTFDANPAFVSYMNEPDIASGRLRQDLLNEAAAEGNAYRVAHFYQEFKRLTAQEHGAPRANAPAAADPRERLVTPQGRVQTTTPDTGKVWTGDEIKRFYADVTKGLYASRPTEAAKIESDINLAISEGRVR